MVEEPFKRIRKITRWLFVVQW